MTETQKEASPSPQEILATEVAKTRKFLNYLQEASARGSRADDAQLASLGMAMTPNRTWYHEGSGRVLEYDVPEGVTPHPVPILMLYSFINRWYILDLMPGHSFIEALTKSGYKVYMLDWGIPGPEHANLGLEYYLDLVARRAVERIRRRHAIDRIFLFGYCLGGTLAAMMAALRPDRYAGLVMLTTPVSFQDAGVLSLWTNKDFFRPEQMPNSLGVVPENLLHASFPFMKPKDQLAKPRNLYQNILDDAFLKNFRSIDRWSTDNIPFPGRVFQEIMQGCYQDDLLVKGEFPLAGRKLNLGDISCPTLNIYARHDHVAPVSSTARSIEYFTGCRFTDREYDASHLTVTVAHPIRETVWKETAAWLDEAEREGSAEGARGSGAASRHPPSAAPAAHKPIRGKGGVA